MSGFTDTNYSRRNSQVENYHVPDASVVDNSFEGQDEFLERLYRISFAVETKQINFPSETGPLVREMIDKGIIKKLGRDSYEISSDFCKKLIDRLGFWRSFSAPAEQTFQIKNAVYECVRKFYSHSSSVNELSRVKLVSMLVLLLISNE